MLGKQVAEVSGAETGRRVLPLIDGRPAMEITFQGTGAFLDVSLTDIGTYTSVMRPDGVLFGDGQGVSMSPQGDALTWRGTGIGHLTQTGGVSFRGAVYYESASPRFAEAVKNAYVYEYEVDEGGKYNVTVWEWK